MKICLIFVLIVSLKSLDPVQHETLSENNQEISKKNSNVIQDSGIENPQNIQQNIQQPNNVQERNLRQLKSKPSTTKLTKSTNNKERNLRRYGRHRRRRRSTQECMVTAEIFPLQYVQITRTAEARIIFESNCIPKKEIVFQYNFEDDKDADFSEPPTTLNFKLFDNYYTIKFSEPKIWDNHDLMRTKYFSKAKFLNIQNEIEMDLHQKATVFLTPQEYNTFSKYNLQKLSNLNQFFDCKIKKNMIPGWKMQASLDYLQYSKFMNVEKAPKKKTYAGVIDVEEAHDRFGARQKKLLLRNKSFKNKKSQQLLEDYDFKTFFKDGKIWIGKNPYINDIEMVCEIH